MELRTVRRIIADVLSVEVAHQDDVEGSDAAEDGELLSVARPGEPSDLVDR